MRADGGTETVPEPGENDGGGFAEAGRHGDELRGAGLAVVAARESALVIVGRVTGGGLKEFGKIHGGKAIGWGRFISVWRGERK